MKLIELGNDLVRADMFKALEKKDTRIQAEDIVDAGGRKVYGYSLAYELVIHLHGGDISHKSYNTRAERDAEYERIKKYLSEMK
jgi:hypothetical protein